MTRLDWQVLGGGLLVFLLFIGWLWLLSSSVRP